MSASALSGVRVIDLTHYIAGPYCTKLMAGFGAEVIKVERPGSGDKLRSVGPFYKDRPGVERSIPFLWLNTGKKSITLNLKTERGRDVFKRLVKDADILVENFSPGVMSGLGLSYEVLREINPRLVMTSISNFGQTGPYRDFKAEEIVEYALSGLMYETGDPDKAPLVSGSALTQYTAGMSAYIGTLVALFHCGVTRLGQHVDVSIQEASITNIEMSMVECLQLGKVRKRQNDRHSMVLWELYPCKDGEVAVISGPMRYWRRAAEIFNEPRLFGEKYDHSLDRRRMRQEYEEILRPCVKKYGKKELFHAGQERNLAFSYLADFDEVLNSPQHSSREFFVEMGHSVVGKHLYSGAPFKMSETPWSSSSAPLLGQDTLDVLGEILCFSGVEIEALLSQEVI